MVLINGSSLEDGKRFSMKIFCNIMCFLSHKIFMKHFLLIQMGPLNWLIISSSSSSLAVLHPTAPLPTASALPSPPSCPLKFYALVYSISSSIPPFLLTFHYNVTFFYQKKMEKKRRESSRERVRERMSKVEQ